MTTLHARDIERFYGTSRALHGVSFRIEGAGLTGLLGRNGAGKSTLLRLLAGQDLPTRGQVALDGLTTTHDGLAWRAQVGFLPEHPALYAEESVQGMILYHLGLHGIFGKQAHARTDEVIARCQLEEVRHARIASLSFGFTKRTGLAVMLSHKPRVVLLDEPGAGLDPAQLIALRALLEDFAREHLIILSSHLLQELALMTPHMLVLHEGRLITHTREQDTATYATLEEHVACALTVPPAQLELALSILHRTGANVYHTSHERSTARVLVEDARRAPLVRALLDAEVDILAWRTLDEQDELVAKFMAWTSEEEE